MTVVPDILIVDGSNTLWRNAVANQKLGFRDEEGEWVHTGGVYGFFQSILSILRRWPEAEVFIAWEAGGKATRREIVPDYKERKPDPKRDAIAQMILPQYGVLERLLLMSGWTQFYAPGWEADDAMGTLALAASNAGLNAMIYSNDADMFQCLRDAEPDEDQGWVHIYKPAPGGAGTLWDVDTLHEEWGICSEQVPHVKGLGGDSSDGYRGAPGIGVKTACKFVSEYFTLEGVIGAAKAGKLTQAKARAILSDVEYLRACLQVATIETRARTVQIPGRRDEEAFREAVTEFRFHSIINSDEKIERICTP